MPDSFDIFLSYHSWDIRAVKIIARVLHNRGFKAFLDKWNLTPGQPWLTEIEDALQMSRAFGIFIGPQGLGPVQVAEMRAALNRKFREKGYPVIPVLLPGSKPENREHLPSFLAQQTWIDFRSGLENEGEMERFIAQISSKNHHPVFFSRASDVVNVDKSKLLRALVLLEPEDLVYLGEITGIRRAEITSDGVKTIAVSLVNRAEIIGCLEELQVNLIIEYPAIAVKSGIT